MTDWRALGDVSPETWTAQLASVGSPLTIVAMSCYRAAVPHTALCLAMLNQESSYAKRFRFNVESNYNPCNLRPPGGDGYLRFSGWTEGIRAWRERLTDPTYKDGIYARTRTIAELISVYAPASDSNDEQSYVAGIEQSLLRWGVTPQEVQPSMAKYTTTIPGLPGGPLVTDYPIHVRILRESMTNNRPGIKAKSPRRSVQHGNGNPNAFAAADSQWLYNGADGGVVSFHAGADEFGVWYNVPADEVTWQAADGAGPGNMCGFSCEMSEHAVYRQDMERLRKNIYVNADFMGRVAARLDIDVPEQHWTFNYENDATHRHNCPNILRTMKINGVPCWTIYTNQWNASKIQELANMNDEPQYATPLPITWKAGDLGWTKLGDVSVYCLEAEVEVVRATTPLAWADGDKSDGEKAPNAGPKLKQGERAKVIGSFANLNEKGQTVRWLIRASDNARIIGSSCRPLLPVKQ